MNVSEHFLSASFIYASIPLDRHSIVVFMGSQVLHQPFQAQTPRL